MEKSPQRVTSDSAPQAFRYYDLVMAAFVAILLLSNLIGASKPSYITLPGGESWIFGAGVLFFPISYIIGDVLTEVYGYARARRVIWTGFAALPEKLPARSLRRRVELMLGALCAGKALVPRPDPAHRPGPTKKDWS